VVRRGVGGFALSAISGSAVLKPDFDNFEGVTDLVSNLLQFLPLGSRVVEIVCLENGQLLVRDEGPDSHLPFVRAVIGIAAVVVVAATAAAVVVVAVVAHEAFLEGLIGAAVDVEVDVVAAEVVARLVVPEELDHVGEGLAALVLAAHFLKKQKKNTFY
jgi:hypothetical protein